MRRCSAELSYAALPPATAKHVSGTRTLFWALRGGGGNFGVVTAMRHRLQGRLWPRRTGRRACKILEILFGETVAPPNIRVRGIFARGDPAAPPFVVTATASFSASASSAVRLLALRPPFEIGPAETGVQQRPALTMFGTHRRYEVEFIPVMCYYNQLNEVPL
jgi:hypothetical protein